MEDLEGVLTIRLAKGNARIKCTLKFARIFLYKNDIPGGVWENWNNRIYL